MATPVDKTLRVITATIQNVLEWKTFDDKIAVIYEIFGKQIQGVLIEMTVQAVILKTPVLLAANLCQVHIQNVTVVKTWHWHICFLILLLYTIMSKRNVIIPLRNTGLTSVIKFYWQCKELCHKRQNRNSEVSYNFQQLPLFLQKKLKLTQSLCSFLLGALFGKWWVYPFTNVNFTFNMFHLHHIIIFLPSRTVNFQG